ncbi:carbamoyltransferase [Bradyrhizobium manausense]|uniref:carbamoyltransferase family protein n=1 Tax=Bradyrhizobium manausense TaxID=989370 RepID=UPI001BAD265D|nr:carbamoyltransferase [Bradyrhizobium manausense]MBR0826202.1 carbamoyltransferase [Bradyrhizobium manausense]
MRILGISAYYHDSAAALIVDGDVVAAAQEERFTRRKHDPSFPANAISYCLQNVGCTPRDLDAIAFYDKPFLKFERLLETYMSFAPAGFSSFRKAMPLWLREKLFQKDLLLREFRKIDGGDIDPKRLLFSEHHFAHAASAFFPSPFTDAAVLTMDGVGEWTTSSLAIGSGNDLAIEKELRFPHSLGLLYSAFTYYLGFKVNSGEYKVMGLAPYGEPKFAQAILDSIVDVKQDGTFWLDQTYFDYCTGLTMTNDRFSNLFGQPVRKPDQLLTQFHMDMAASIQAVTEEIVLKLGRSIRAETGARHLCLAGGVALNCVANGKLLKERIFEDIWIQPAAGDAGGAVGTALAAYHVNMGQPRRIRPNRQDGMSGGYLGPEFSQDGIEQELKVAKACFTTLSDDELINATAQALAEGKAVGWMQGRMEFGPRALGARSILGDPRSASMQKMLNLKVKYRESFRPFAPSVLREDVSEWFELDCASPYMLLVADVVASRRRQMTASEASLFGIDKLNVPRSEIPAVTHVDYSARIQTVDREVNAPYHALISRFKALTGCPVLVNTSFNVRGEPIVCTPTDAFRCFMGSEIEVLVVGNAYLKKEEQDHGLKLNYEHAFELD